MGKVTWHMAFVLLCDRAIFVFSFNADPYRFTKRRRSTGVGDPKHRIFRRLGERIAAQVGEIDQANRRDIILSDPFERRAEVRAPTAFGLKSAPGSDALNSCVD